MTNDKFISESLKHSFNRFVRNTASLRKDTRLALWVSYWINEPICSKHWFIREHYGVAWRGSAVNFALLVSIWDSNRLQYTTVFCYLHIYVSISQLNLFFLSYLLCNNVPDFSQIFTVWGAHFSTDCFVNLLICDLILALKICCYI